MMEHKVGFRLMARDTTTTPYELPKQIERVLASAAMYFNHSGETQLQRLIVNARITIEEAFSFDNWDGGQTGHRLHLQVPAELYYSVLPNQNMVEQQLVQVLNQMVRLD